MASRDRKVATKTKLERDRRHLIRCLVGNLSASQDLSLISPFFPSPHFLPLLNDLNCSFPPKKNVEEKSPIGIEMKQRRNRFILTNTTIIKITISSIVIGLKNSYFPLILLPSY